MTPPRAGSDDRAPVTEADGSYAADAGGRRDATSSGRRHRHHRLGAWVLGIGGTASVLFLFAVAAKLTGEGIPQSLGLVAALLVIVYVAFSGGFGPGLAAAAVLSLYAVWQYGGRGSDGVIVVPAAAVTTASLVGWMRMRVAAAIRRAIAAELREAQALREKYRALAQANEELQRFAYVASHDLQEPLRTVSSFTQLLAQRYKGRLDADADEFIDYAVDGANRMQNLIEDLLAYSRVGGQELKRTPVPLDDVVARVRKALDQTINETEASIEHDPLPVVWGDRSQIEQLLQNLVANALKFRRPDARPSVRVFARRATGSWEVSVKDNGIGISPVHQGRIFVIFQRLHPRDQYPGTGIGLAICQRIVELHGGRIWVESSPGLGSTFHFTLPDPHVAQELPDAER